MRVRGERTGQEPNRRPGGAHGLVRRIATILGAGVFAAGAGPAAVTGAAVVAAPPCGVHSAEIGNSRMAANMSPEGLFEQAPTQVAPDDLKPFIGEIITLTTTQGPAFKAYVVAVTGTGSTGTVRVVRCTGGDSLIISAIRTTDIDSFQPS